MSITSPVFGSTYLPPRTNGFLVRSIPVFGISYLLGSLELFRELKSNPNLLLKFSPIIPGPTRGKTLSNPLSNLLVAALGS